MNAADDQLGARVRALAEAVEAIDGRGTPDVVTKAKSVVERAGERVAFSGSYTVVAFAGATGSGKSSLFNAVLDAVDVRPEQAGEIMAAVADLETVRSSDERLDFGVSRPAELSAKPSQAALGPAADTGTGVLEGAIIDAGQEPG